MPEVLALRDGPQKTAELVAWIQGLYDSELVKKRKIGPAWESLRVFARRFRSSDPTPEEMVQWAEGEET